jgi:hypothetical protein
LLGPVAAAVAGLPEAKNFCETSLQDMVEITQRMEDAAKLGSAKSNTSAGNTTSNAGPIRHKSKTQGQSHGKKHDSSGGNASVSGSLTGNERSFLQSNIARGGGLIVHDRAKRRGIGEHGHLEKACVSDAAQKGILLGIVKQRQTGQSQRG